MWCLSILQSCSCCARHLHNHVLDILSALRWSDKGQPRLEGLTICHTLQVQAEPANTDIQ